MYRNVSLILAFREDIPARMDNLKIVTEYYKKEFPNIEIIVVENDVSSKISATKDALKFIDKYKFIEDKNIQTHTYTKSHGLNIGMLLSTRKYIAVVDVDSMVFPSSIDKSIPLANKDNCGCVIGYNGGVILIQNLMKDQFKNNPSLLSFSEYFSFVKCGFIWTIGIFVL